MKTISLETNRNLTVLLFLIGPLTVCRCTPDDNFACPTTSCSRPCKPRSIIGEPGFICTIEETEEWDDVKSSKYAALIEDKGYIYKHVPLLTSIDFTIVDGGRSFLRISFQITDASKATYLRFSSEQYGSRNTTRLFFYPDYIAVLTLPRELCYCLPSIPNGLTRRESYTLVLKSLPGPGVTYTITNFAKHSEVAPLHFVETTKVAVWRPGIASAVVEAGRYLHVVIEPNVKVKAYRVKIVYVRDRRTSPEQLIEPGQTAKFTNLFQGKYTVVVDGILTRDNKECCHAHSNITVSERFPVKPVGRDEVKSTDLFFALGGGSLGVALIVVMGCTMYRYTRKRKDQRAGSSGETSSTRDQGPLNNDQEVTTLLQTLAEFNGSDVVTGPPSRGTKGDSLLKCAWPNQPWCPTHAQDSAPYP